MDDTAILENVKSSLGASLQLGEKLNAFNSDTRLLGEVAELDSMAILTVVTGLEEHFDIVIEDDDLSADTFETVGSLVALVQRKLA